MILPFPRTGRVMKLILILVMPTLDARNSVERVYQLTVRNGGTMTDTLSDYSFDYPFHYSF